MLMDAKHRVVVVEDHTLLRQGLIALITADDNIEVVGETNNGRDAIQLAHSSNPNLILMDLSMPGLNGIEAMIEIKKRNPKIKVLVLTVHMAEEYIKQSLKAGADGYILKHSTGLELLQAINSVINGKTYLSPEVSNQVVHSFINNESKIGHVSQLDLVTLREREILKLVAEGNQNKQIADYLCLSVKTVEKHRSNLMKKLDMHNSAALTAFAIEMGLVEKFDNLVYLLSMTKYISHLPAFSCMLTGAVMLIYSDFGTIATGAVMLILSLLPALDLFLPKYSQQSA